MRYYYLIELTLKTYFAQIFGILADILFNCFVFLIA